jgi:hypothetical protein
MSSLLFVASDQPCPLLQEVLSRKVHCSLLFVDFCGKKARQGNAKQGKVRQCNQKKGKETFGKERQRCARKGMERKHWKYCQVDSPNISVVQKNEPPLNDFYDHPHCGRKHTEVACLVGKTSWRASRWLPKEINGNQGNQFR